MYRLYRAPDNASLIIQILLEETGAPFETVAVDRTTREQEGEAYRALNPAGLIPACIIDGEAVFETGAIGLMICEREGLLAPSVGSPGRSSFLKWLFFLSNSLHTDLRQLFYPEKYVPENIEGYRSITLARLEHHIGIMEIAFERSPGIYLFGDEPTLADVYLGVCLRWAQLYPLDAERRPDMKMYPEILRMMLTLQDRPSVAKACAAEGIAAPFLISPVQPDGSKGAAL